MEARHLLLECIFSSSPSVQRCYRFVCISTGKLNPFVRTWPSISWPMDNIHGNFPPVGHRFPRTDNNLLPALSHPSILHFARPVPTL